MPFHRVIEKQRVIGKGICLPFIRGSWTEFFERKSVGTAWNATDGSLESGERTLPVIKINMGRTIYYERSMLHYLLIAAEHRSASVMIEYRDSLDTFLLFHVSVKNSYLFSRRRLALDSFHRVASSDRRSKSQMLPMASSERESDLSPTLHPHFDSQMVKGFTHSIRHEQQKGYISIIVSPTICYFPRQSK